MPRFRPLLVILCILYSRGDDEKLHDIYIPRHRVQSVHHIFTNECDINFQTTVTRTEKQSSVYLWNPWVHLGLTGYRLLVTAPAQLSFIVRLCVYKFSDTIPMTHLHMLRCSVERSHLGLRRVFNAVSLVNDTHICLTFNLLMIVPTIFNKWVISCEHI